MRLDEVFGSGPEHAVRTRHVGRAIVESIGDRVAREQFESGKNRFVSGHNREIFLGSDQKGFLVEFRSEVGAFVHHYPKTWSTKQITDSVSWLFNRLEEIGDFESGVTIWRPFPKL